MQEDRHRDGTELDDKEENARGFAPEQPASETCAQQARKEYNDISVDDLAGYLEDSIVFPKNMSYMAEMMYT